jgi:hypothetical protein
MNKTDMKRTKYTKADEGFIIANWRNYTDEQLAKMFGVSVGAFQQKRLKLGCIGRENTGRFKPGHKPHPMPAWKPNSGTFKKGHKTYNTREIGSTCKHADGYTYVKTEKGMELLHRAIYEAHYGSIPKGYIVVFKDKNTDNFSPENLEAISLTEHLSRNRNYKKAAESLKETWEFAKTRAERGDFRSWYKNKVKKI